MPQEHQNISRVSAEPTGDGSRDATSGAERLALGSRRALDMYLLYESAVVRHMALFNRVCAAREEAAVTLAALEYARASRAQAQLGRELLREAVRAQVRGMKSDAVPVERVLRLVRASVGDATATPGVLLPHMLVDELGNEMVQWAIQDYFDAA